MTKMTEREAWELDELLTKTDPDIGINGTGFLSMRDARIMGIDDLALNYLITKAEYAHTTPAHIIGELVRKELATGTV